MRIERDGVVLAETRRPTLAFETNLPVRFYVPREDVRVDLRPSTRVTACAYKGVASYWSTDRLDDVGWSYEHPLPDAVELAGLVAFWDELADVTVDGVRHSSGPPEIAAVIREEATS